MKAFDEPLGESNTERRVKISDSISKKKSHIFIVKFKNFTSGVKILEFKSNRKSEDFPKGENLHSKTFLEGVIFWGEITNLGGRLKFFDL